MILSMLLAAVIQSSGFDHTFEFTSSTPLAKVNLAGTFNNWDSQATAMEPNASKTVWRRTMRLAAGRHMYKFVLNGDQWITDPKGKIVEDGNGNQNTLLLLLPPDYNLPARKGDGRIATTALLHGSEVPFRNWDRGRLALSLRVRPDDIQSVTLIANRKTIQGTVMGADELYQTISFQVPWDRKSDLMYTFKLDDGDRPAYFGNNVLSSTPQNFHLKAKDFRPFETPAWVERSVVYQIFPDRFDNGDLKNDPDNVQKWDAEPTYFNRFGGDIAGVEKRLSYLRYLGVGAIYFNPVFASPSNHRYDASDFHKIDPEFGTNQEWAQMTRKAESLGIKTVMDFAFNHSATNFAPFQDLVTKGQESKFKDWYFPKSFPVKVQDPPNYVAWYNFPSMPKFNHANPEARSYLLNVVDFWRSVGPLHGARLDVANEVPMDFWRDFRTKEKLADKNLWILGEEWGDASAWLKGDQWDASMNYPFREACLQFFATGNESATRFRDRLTSLYARYAPQVSRNQLNLLSSHDTERFLTLAGGDAARQRLAAAVQMTWVGTPSIYYGEEIGMEGGRDPQNRRGMVWARANKSNPMLAYYQQLVQLRNESKALQSGDPVWLLANDDAKTVAYARVLDSHVALVAVNRSGSAQPMSLSLGGPLLKPFANAGFADALSGLRVSAKRGQLNFNLPPMSAAILRPSKVSSSGPGSAGSAILTALSGFKGEH